MQKKLIFWSFFLLTLVIAALTILPSVDISAISKYSSLISKLFLRSLGLLVYILLFWQIMIGANTEKWVEKLGGWFFNFHVFLGVAAYSFAILHLISFLLFRYFLGSGFDPIFVFLGFCVFCQKQVDAFYSSGRFAFYFLTLAVFAGLFRSFNIFMRTNWRKFHVLNYLVFFLSGVHGFFLGTDFTLKPFFYFAILANILVAYTIVKKLPQLISFYKNWLNS